jgi:branched-chain amino acid transport system substrate-binding protein
MVLPLTQQNAAFAQPLIAAVNLAVRQVNVAGGVNGEPVELVAPIDEGQDLADVRQRIGEGDFDAIVGPATSADALALAETVDDLGVVTCSPTAGTVALSRFGNRFLFRTFPSDALQGAALAEAINGSGLGTGRVVIVYPSDEYGQAIADRVPAQLNPAVANVELTLPYDLDATDGDLDALAGQAVAANPDVVVVVGMTDGGGRMLSRLRLQNGFARVPQVYVSAAMRDPKLLERVAPSNPEALENVRGVSPLANPYLRTFTEELEQESAEAGISYASYAYDCVNLIALAAQAAGSNDPRQFQGELVDVSQPNPGSRCETFATCKAILAQDLNIDYNGISGPVDIDRNGDVTSARYELFGFDQSGRDVRVLDFLAPR